MQFVGASGMDIGRHVIALEAWLDLSVWRAPSQHKEGYKSHSQRYSCLCHLEQSFWDVVERRRERCMMGQACISGCLCCGLSDLSLESCQLWLEGPHTCLWPTHLIAKCRLCCQKNCLHTEQLLHPWQCAGEHSTTHFVMGKFTWKLKREGPYCRQPTHIRSRRGRRLGRLLQSSFFLKRYLKRSIITFSNWAETHVEIEEGKRGILVVWKLTV